MHIEEKIKKKILNEGPISFHDYMEMALYDPCDGYYNSVADKIGKDGDYYTSPCLTNIFGAMIGKQIEEMWEKIGEPAFAIIEYGAGNGTLCFDILQYLKENSSLYKNLTYYIIEKSPAMIESEKNLLVAFPDKVKWINSISEVAGITGCVLSNELVDNFSTHQVIMQDELMEVFVDYNGKFAEQLKPASEELKNYLTRFNILLPGNYRTEINLEAENWMKEVAAALKKGFVLTIDYGHTAAELYNEQRKTGTLLCFFKHTINDNAFDHIGEQDITTHVNFSALAKAGAVNGLNCCGYTTQSSFLFSNGVVNYIRHLEACTRSIDCSQLSLYMLLYKMGQKIKVLMQEKGVGAVSFPTMQFSLKLI
jgi:SAM-dependent MidA family methyltransferase